MAVAPGIVFVSFLLVLNELAVGQQCGEVGSEQSHRAQGTPGKRGEKGDPGIVDYRKMDKEINNRFKLLQGLMEAMIDEKVKAAVQEMSKTFETKAKPIERPTAKPTEKTAAITAAPSLCGVRYKTKCFLPILHQVQNVTWAEGRKMCFHRGGDIASIHDEEHFSLVMSYIRDMIPDRPGLVYVWIGMTLIAGKVYNMERQPAAFVRWHPRLPIPSSSVTNIYIIVRKRENNVNQGFVNDSPTSQRYGVLCEI